MTSYGFFTMEDTFIHGYASEFINLLQGYVWHRQTLSKNSGVISTIIHVQLHVLLLHVVPVGIRARKCYQYLFRVVKCDKLRRNSDEITKANFPCHKKIPNFRPKFISFYIVVPDSLLVTPLNK
jgi:type II secretory pathway component PulL